MSDELREYLQERDRKAKGHERQRTAGPEASPEKFHYRLLDRNDLRARGIKYSRPHLDRLMKGGKFPKSIALGENRRAWLESEIDAFIASRIAARDARAIT
jgi:prophage regulatory protein